MQVDSSGLKVYWTIFRSVLCDHFQVRRNMQENFGKLIIKMVYRIRNLFFIFQMHNLKDSEIKKKNIKMNLDFFSEYY